jgi:hypothetical protein
MDMRGPLIPRAFVTQSLVIQFLLLSGAFLIAGCALGVAARNAAVEEQALVRARTIAAMAEALAIWSGRYRGIWVHNDPTDPVPELGEFLDHKQARGSMPDGHHRSAVPAAADTRTNVDVAQNGGTFHRKVPALVQREIAQVFGTLSEGERFRMTSDRFLDPRNAPNRFELAAIERLRASGETAEYQEAVDGRLLYARPLSASAACLRCHDAAGSGAPPASRNVAVSGASPVVEGAFAGIVSVSVPVRGSGTGPRLGSLRWIEWVLAAFVLAGWAGLILWLQHSVVRRADALVRHAQAVVAGSGSPLIAHLNPLGGTSVSRNEVDRLVATVKLLCRTAQAMSHAQARGSAERASRF